MLKAVITSMLATSISGCVLQLPPQQQSQQLSQSVPTPQANAGPQSGPPGTERKPTPAASRDNWIDFGTGSGMTFQMKGGSFRFDHDKSGEVVAVGLGRILDNNRGSVDPGQWYVTIDDCSRGMGSLVTTDINGNFKWQSDFMFDAGNIASTIAQAICSVAYQQANELKRSQDQNESTKRRREGI